jgi:hypothetical protein
MKINKTERLTLNIVRDIYRYGTNKEKQLLNDLIELYESNCDMGKG